MGKTDEYGSGDLPPRYEVGWIVKWRGHFGERTGKVVGEFSDTASYISERRSTQGFPGSSGPMLVSHKDIIEVVSRGE